MPAIASDIVTSVIASPIAMIVTNPRKRDNPIEIANAAFLTLTGYAEQEVVGRNCRFLAGERTESLVQQQIRAAIAARRPVLVDILNYRKDGTPFRNGLMVTPVFGDDGELAWFLGSQVALGADETAPLSARQSRAAELVGLLPRRQGEVLRGMTDGLLNKQIAHRLGIAEKTVKMHRALLIERLGVSTSAEAIRIGVEAGL